MAQQAEAAPQGQQPAQDDKVTLPGDQIKALFDKHGDKQDKIAQLAQRLELTPEEVARLRSGAPLTLTPAQYQGMLRAMSEAYAQQKGGKQGPGADGSGARASDASSVCGSDNAPTPTTTTPATGHVPAVTGTFTRMTETSPGTTAHTATVGSGSSQGTVTLRTGVDTTSVYHGMFAISYQGPDSQNAHWLQFIWREIIGVHSDNSSHPVTGSIRTTTPNPYQLTANGSATTVGTPGVDNYNTDSLDPANPFYETSATATANRTADATTMYDQPAAQMAYVQAAFRNGAARVVSRAHFNTFLIQNDHVTYRVQTNVVWDIASATAIDNSTPGTMTNGSSGAATALPDDMRTRLHAQYPAFAFIN